jgi:hypothetical protein
VSVRKDEHNNHTLKILSAVTKQNFSAHVHMYLRTKQIAFYTMPWRRLVFKKIIYGKGGGDWEIFKIFHSSAVAAAA